MTIPSGLKSARVVLALAAAVVFTGCQRAPSNDEPAAETAAEPQQLWTCGMHPQVIRDRPGFCPICGMALTPLKAGPGGEPAKAGEVTIDPVVVQNMGVRVTNPVEGPLRAVVRAAGYLDEAQPNQRAINLRVSGWIERLYADTEGMHLRAGEPLFDLYSPELQVAIEELRAARQNRGTLSDDLVATAERKLQLLGIDSEQIRRFAVQPRAPATVTFTSPITGHLVKKMIVAGSAVKAGDEILRIVDHSTLWLDAQVYEQDLPFIRLGQKARATVATLPGVELTGEIIFIHPHIEPMSRTAMVRVAIANPVLALRPGGYARVEIEAELAPHALLVPREAVIDTGTRQLVFVALDAGRFEPRQVKLGPAGGDGMVQILSGLEPQDTVVTSGQFLLDSESRLREAIQKHLQEKMLRPAVPHAH